MFTQSFASRFVLALAGAVVFFYLFWLQPLGFNLVLYTVFQLTAIAVFKPHLCRQRLFATLSLAWLLAAAQVAYSGEGGNIFLYFILFFCWMGAAAHQSLRSFWALLLSAIANLPKAGIRFLDEALNPNPKKARLTMQKRLQLLLIPFVLTLLFFVFYAAGDSRFLWQIQQLLHFIGQTIGDETVPKIIFLCLGFGLMLPVYFSPQQHWFTAETKLSDTLLRRRRRPLFAFGTLGLKDEFRIALLTFLLLNLLLLVLNAANWVAWFDNTPTSAAMLSRDVHEGVYMLIFSIFLAAALVLIFFRRNLNFYPQRGQLRRLCYVWLAQNIVLVGNVLVKNFAYMQGYGLTQKRIGVMIFLLMVVGGLVMVAVKIATRKTNYFLWRETIWLGLGILLLSLTPSFDRLIARYNIETAKSGGILDIRYLVRLDENAYPTIEGEMVFLRKVCPPNKQGLLDEFTVKAQEYHTRNMRKPLLSRTYLAWQAMR